MINALIDKFKKMKCKQVIIDDFPRCQENIDDWNKMMEEYGEVIGVLHLVCDDEEMKRRLKCKKYYIIYNNEIILL